MFRMTKKNQNNTSFYMKSKNTLGLPFLIFLLLPSSTYAHSGGITLGIFLYLYALYFLLIISVVNGLAALFSSYLKFRIIKIPYITHLDFSSNSIKLVTICEIILMTIIFIVFYRLIDKIDLLLLTNYPVFPDTIAIWYHKIISSSKFSLHGLSYSQWCAILFITIPCYFPFAIILHYIFLWKNNNPNKNLAFMPATFTAIFSLIMPTVLIIFISPMFLSNSYPEDRELNDILHSASVLSHQKLVSALINEGVDINFKGKDGKTVLMLPFSSKNYTSWKQNEVIEILLDHGADVNAKDDYGNTALMHACKLVWSRGGRGYMYPIVGSRSITILIDNGAKVNAKNNKGMTALMIAIDNDCDMAKQLIQNGADVNAKDKEGRTALMTNFRSYYDTRTMKLLLKKGADVGVKDNEGRTALMMQASPKRAKLLLEYGADINSTDKDGNTALMIAAANTKMHPETRLEIIKFLIFNGADVNAKNKSGKTALMLAASISKEHPVEPFEIIKFLLSNGANLNLKDKDGNTALELARKHGHFSFIKLLQNSLVNKKPTRNN